MFRIALGSLLVSASLLGGSGLAQQGSGQDDKILERGDTLLQEAKAAYKDAGTKASVAALDDAGFKFEEARIQFIVLQEYGSPDQQKIATDRLRAITHLSKLIYKEKLALSTPAEEPTMIVAVPASPPPATDPPSKPVQLPRKTAVDGTTRIPVPDLPRQREAEKRVKDLFKAQYSMKAPAERLALAKSLLELALQPQADPAGIWVLFREAQDTAVQVGDLRLALESVNKASLMFDTDGTTMKNAVLTNVGKTAKTPADFTGLAEAHLLLSEEFSAIDQYEAADKAVTMSLLYSRKAADFGLINSVTSRQKELTEIRTAYLAMKGAFQTLAKTPEDPSATLQMGQFLCVYKGRWDLGLRFLLRCSNDGLKGLAEKELALPTQAADLVAVADAWTALADGEKNPHPKAQIQKHAVALYEAALPSATGLTKAKIEWKLDSYEMGTSGGIDLLKIIDPQRDSVLGDWAMNGRALICLPSAVARLQIPYSPPEEYDVRVIVERMEGIGSFDVGLVTGSIRFGAELDCRTNRSGIQSVDGKTIGNMGNETMKMGHQLTNGTASVVVYSVRKTQVSVTLDGKVIIDYHGKMDRLSVDASNTIPNPRALSVGTWNPSRLKISEFRLTPVSGEGKRLR